jgi:LysR family transcriptional regulator, regulator of abg operon
VRINQIRDFIAVIQAGSLRAAARAVGVSQPAITKSIRQLEAELQVSLLQRNARGAAATPAGKIFLSRARVVQAELRKATEDLEAFQGGSEGNVAFGIAPAACMLIVPEAMQPFRRRYPAARVRIVEGVNTALLPLVRDETLDFCIGQAPVSALDPALIFRPLFHTPLVVAGRKGHPLRAATSLADLAEAPWLMFYQLGAGAMLEQAFAAAGAPMPRSIVHCESYAIALALLAKTDTLCLMIPQMVSGPQGHQGLQQIRIRETLPAPLIGMYTRSDAPLTRAAAGLAQAIKASARRLAKRS